MADNLNSKLQIKSFLETFQRKSRVYVYFNLSPNPLQYTEIYYHVLDTKFVHYFFGGNMMSRIWRQNFVLVLAKIYG